MRATVQRLVPTNVAAHNIFGVSQEAQRCVARAFQIRAWHTRIRGIATRDTQIYEEGFREHRKISTIGSRKTDPSEIKSTRQAGIKGNNALRIHRPLSSTKVLDSPLGGPENEKVFKSRESWQLQKSALRAKFPAGWQPRKRLSPDAVEGIRTLHAKDPEVFKTSSLAEQFKVSPEAIRRILKSKWKPSEEEQDERKERWERRGEKIWADKAAQGFKMPRRWRASRKVGAPKKPRWRDMQPAGARTSSQACNGSGLLADKIG